MNENDIFIEYQAKLSRSLWTKIEQLSQGIDRPSNSSNLLVTATPREVPWRCETSISWDPNNGILRILEILSSVLKVKTTGKSNEGNKWNKVLGKSMHVHLQVGFAGLRSNDLVPKCNLQDHVVWKTTESSHSFAVSALFFLYLRCYYDCCCCGCCCCHFLTAPSLPRNLLVALSGSAPGSRNKAAEWWSEYKNYELIPQCWSQNIYIYISYIYISNIHFPHLSCHQKGSKTINFHWFGPARWYDLLLPQDPALVHPSWWRFEGLIAARYRTWKPRMVDQSTKNSVTQFMSFCGHIISSKTFGFFWLMFWKRNFEDGDLPIGFKHFVACPCWTNVEKQVARTSSDWRFQMLCQAKTIRFISANLKNTYVICIDCIIHVMYEV